MRRTLRALLLAGLVASAQAGIVVVQEADQKGGPMPGKTTLTLKLEGEKARMDMGKTLSSIVDFKAGTIVSLLHAQKLAMPLPGATLDAARQAATGNAGKPDLKPTGRTETISGFPCEEYVGKFQGLDVAYWVTKKELPAQASLLKQMGALSGNGDPLKAALANGADFPGFPIRTVISTPAMGKSTMTVVSITETEIPASEFSAPANYQTMALPNLPGIGR